MQSLVRGCISQIGLTAITASEFKWLNTVGVYFLSAQFRVDVWPAVFHTVIQGPRLLPSVLCLPLVLGALYSFGGWGE